MKLEIAIYTLDSLTRAPILMDDQKVVDAFKLGIEALRRVKDSRRPDPLYPEKLLPGETH